MLDFMKFLAMVSALCIPYLLVILINSKPPKEGI